MALERRSPNSPRSPGSPSSPQARFSTLFFTTAFLLATVFAASVHAQPGGVEPVTLLSCSTSLSNATGLPGTTGAPMATVTLEWSNAAPDYDAIEIVACGSLVETLPGSATTTTVSLPLAQEAHVQVIAVRAAEAAPPTGCTLRTPELPPAVIALSGSSLPGSGNIDLEWVNGGTYDAINVWRDGGLESSHPGDATTATITGATLDSVAQIEVVAWIEAQGPLVIGDRAAQVAQAEVGVAEIKEDHGVLHGGARQLFVAEDGFRETPVVVGGVCLVEGLVEGVCAERGEEGKQESGHARPPFLRAASSASMAWAAALVRAFTSSLSSEPPA